MKLTRIWFADDRIYGEAENHETLWQSLLWYRRLRSATDEQRNDYKMDDEGIHWYALDEDVSFESFYYEEREPQGISRALLSQPELNTSALAKRTGISSNTILQYMRGMRKPSKEHEQLILQHLGN